MIPIHKQIFIYICLFLNVYTHASSSEQQSNTTAPQGVAHLIRNGSETSLNSDDEVEYKSVKKKIANQKPQSWTDSLQEFTQSTAEKAHKLLYQELDTLLSQEKLCNIPSFKESFEDDADFGRFLHNALIQAIKQEHISHITTVCRIIQSYNLKDHIPLHTQQEALKRLEQISLIIPSITYFHSTDQSSPPSPRSKTAIPLLQAIAKLYQDPKDAQTSALQALNILKERAKQEC